MAPGREITGDDCCASDRWDCDKCRAPIQGGTQCPRCDAERPRPKERGGVPDSRPSRGAAEEPEEGVPGEQSSGGAGYSTMDKIDRERNCAKAACHITVGAAAAEGQKFASGCLVDGAPVGLPRACVLTNHHVLPAEDAARGAIARFNYDGADDDRSRWIEVNLNPDLGFVHHKDSSGLDFCLVACDPYDPDTAKLGHSLAGARDTEFPAPLVLAKGSLEGGDLRAAYSDVRPPITIWGHPDIEPRGPHGGFKKLSKGTLIPRTDGRRSCFACCAAPPAMVRPAPPPSLLREAR
eukprot:COSAG04_NODE_664_length_11441_cov_5.400458_1_plen_294_part_00